MLFCLEVLIQSLFRGAVARGRARRRRSRIRTNAATLIACVYRGYCARKWWDAYGQWGEEGGVGEG